MRKFIRYLICALYAILFLSSGMGLFAFGRRDDAEAGDPVNTEWKLCITAFDVSALPVSRHITGDTVMRHLAEAVGKMDFRSRGEEETAYYREVSWARMRADAAIALQTKRNERDLLVYKGDAAWRYRKNLKTVDAAIKGLEEDLVKINALAPVVEGKPALRLSDGNLNGVFSPPPETGTEYQFCTAQGADAVLVGSLSEYHDRLYLSVMMYTLYTRSYSYEDLVLFSSEDLNGAIDEIAYRLTAAVAGILPSAVIVKTNPPDAMVSIDNSFAGRGNMEMYSHSPGPVEIAIRADNHVPASFPVDLEEGMLTEIYIDLTPFGYTAFEMSVPGSSGSAVFVGSLYVGDAPLTLQLPKSQFSYISVITPEGDTGSVVYRDNTLVRGSAQFTRASEDGNIAGRASIGTKTPISPEEKRVDRARRGFYGAYGAFWVILPLALITSGIANNYINSNNYVAASGQYYNDYPAQKEIYDKAVTANKIRIGANIAWGTALGVTFFQIFRYLYVSGGDASPIIKAPAPMPETVP